MEAIKENSRFITDLDYDLDPDDTRTLRNLIKNISISNESNIYRYASELKLFLSKIQKKYDIDQFLIENLLSSVSEYMSNMLILSGKYIEPQDCKKFNSLVITYDLPEELKINDCHISDDEFIFKAFEVEKYLYKGSDEEELFKELMNKYLKEYDADELVEDFADELAKDYIMNYS